MVARAGFAGCAALQTQLFVVHVWRQRSRFRAAVRRVDSDERLVFATPADLARYLAAASRSLASDPGDAQPAAGPHKETSP